MQIVQKHLQRKLVIDHLRDLLLLDSQSKSSLGARYSAVSLHSQVKLGVFVMLSALEARVE